MYCSRRERAIGEDFSNLAKTELVLLDVAMGLMVSRYRCKRELKVPPGWPHASDSCESDSQMPAEKLEAFPV
jgi:hypothetical protein